MPHLPRWLAWALVACLSSLAVRAHADQELPRFDPIPCPFAATEAGSEEAECGWLLVPEDRQQPRGRALRLTVVRLRAVAETPENDPVVYLSGGPGSSEISQLAAWLSHPLRQRRDLLLIDQRGTGTFGGLCPDLFRQAMQIMARDGDAEADRVDHVAAARACRRQLVERGIDPRHVHSRASVADLADLRAVLGYDKLNLLGISYGSRLALTALRDAPDLVRSVVLISPLGPEMDFYADLPRHLSSAFEQLAADCAAAPECARAMPDFQQALAELLDRLTVQPLTVAVDDGELFPSGAVVINRQDLLMLVGELMASDGLRSIVPALVGALRAGRSDFMAPLLRVFAHAYADIDLGMYYAVQCQEELPFHAAGASSPGGGLSLAAIGMIGAVESVCADWRLTPAAGRENLPVVSSAPALVLTGQLDYKTPPAYAHAVAANLSRGHTLVVPGKGHGALRDPCLDVVVERFVDHPFRSPSSSCLESMRSKPPVGAVSPAPGVLTLLLALRGASGWTLAWLGGSLVPLATVLMVVPLRWWWRRRQRRRAGADVASSTRHGRMRALSETALWCAALLAWSFTVLVAAAVTRLMDDDRAAVLLLGLPTELGWVLQLPKLAALCTAIGMGGAVAGWRCRTWRVGARIYELAALGSAASLVAFWLAYGLL